MKKIFLILDLVMPQFLSRMPYFLATQIVLLKFKKYPNINVWFRNSYQEKNIVFGISDLDISIMIKNTDQELINSIKNELIILRKFIPFLGETNFFIQEHMKSLSPSLNVYEKKRDYILDEQLKDYVPFGMNVEQIVFILRMLNSDKKNLRDFPFSRQKKWKGHFKKIFQEHHTYIDRHTIVSKLKKLINSPEKNSDLDKVFHFLFENLLPPHEIVNLQQPLLWSFLFPNIHIWTDEDYTNSEYLKNTIFAHICLRQIDWEIWGISTQFPFIYNNDKNIERHMTRLKNVAIALEASPELINRIDLMISYAKPFEIH